MTTDNKVDPAFAAAVATILNPNLQAEQVYAAAFADATKQIQAGLESPNTLAGEIRARAAQLNELADLIDTTLAAAAMPVHDKSMDKMHDKEMDKGKKKDGDGPDDSPSQDCAEDDSPSQDGADQGEGED